MGEPVKIVDLAQNMIRLSGKEPERDIPIEFIGVRAGREARTRSCGARARRLCRPRIRRSFARLDADRPVWLDDELADLERLVEAGDTIEVVARLAEMLGTPQRLAAAAEAPAPAAAAMPPTPS